MSFEKPKIEKKPKNQYEVTVPDKFWALIQQRLDLPDVPNPNFIKINFSSSHPKVNEKSKLEDENFNPEENVVIQGVFDYDAEELHFNIKPDEVEKEVLAKVIVHELIHYAQIQGKKYPEMKPPFDNDKKLPWEKEAYSLMESLAKQYLKDFELEKVE